MRYMGVLVTLVSLVLLSKAATANVLSPGDYENFRNLDLKMLSIGDDIYGLVTAQPGTHAPDCVIELAFKFDAVQADLHGVGTLVALAANRSRGRAPGHPTAEPCGSGFYRAIEISPANTEQRNEQLC